jgi:hypothetical protein
LEQLPEGGKRPLEKGSPQPEVLERAKRKKYQEGNSVVRSLRT